MKCLPCGCRITEEDHSLVRAGVLGIGDRLEDCYKCRAPPKDATYYSTVEGQWVRFTNAGFAQLFNNGIWSDFAHDRQTGIKKGAFSGCAAIGSPKGLIKKM